MKYYYDNLADALQAMRHGIKIADESANAFQIELLDILYENVLQDAFKVFNHKFKFYVREESEYLLEPQHGDVSQDAIPFIQTMWFNGMDRKTAFRNGIYFPQPKEIKE